LVIRWFRSIATTSTPGDPTGSGRGFGTDAAGARAISFIPYYWLPIRGEIASAKPRRDGGGQA
jgi:hypothetical protein